jgi:hypothetical protein
MLVAWLSVTELSTWPTRAAQKVIGGEMLCSLARQIVEAQKFGVRKSSRHTIFRLPGRRRLSEIGTRCGGFPEILRDARNKGFPLARTASCGWRNGFKGKGEMLGLSHLDAL